MDDQNKNLIMATVLSFAVIVAWTTIFPPEELPVDLTEQTTQVTQDATLPIADPVASDATTPTAAQDTVAEAPRVPIETAEFSGSISLLGGRIDDLALSQYRETLDEGVSDLAVRRRTERV